MSGHNLGTWIQDILNDVFSQLSLCVEKLHTVHLV
jgi:hypothetical protein